MIIIGIKGGEGKKFGTPGEGGEISPTISTPLQGGLNLFLQTIEEILSQIKLGSVFGSSTLS